MEFKLELARIIRVFHRRENGFKKRPHLGQLLDPDDEVPCALELLPPRAVEEVL